MHEAAFRGRFSIAATRAAIARANGRHNLTVLRAALEANSAGSAGTRSWLEDAFIALVRSGGVAEPLVNVHVQAGSRRIEVDFHWPDLRLCVETDGDGHTRPRTKRADDIRDRALRAAGYEVLRCTRDDVEQRAPWVLARLRTAIHERTPPPAADTAIPSARSPVLERASLGPCATGATTRSRRPTRCAAGWPSACTRLAPRSTS